MSNNNRITNPTIELLAIHLHAQACIADGIGMKSWLNMHEEDREIFREMARGNEPLDDEVKESVA